ncbi:hypothetical protein [Eoetvoesiella caeni]
MAYYMNTNVGGAEIKLTRTRLYVDRKFVEVSKAQHETLIPLFDYDNALSAVHIFKELGGLSN